MSRRYDNPAPGHLLTGIVCLIAGGVTGWQMTARRASAPETHRAAAAAETETPAGPLPGDYLRDAALAGKASGSGECRELAEKMEQHWGRHSAEFRLLFFTLAQRWTDPSAAGAGAGAQEFVAGGRPHLATVLAAADALAGRAGAALTAAGSGADRDTAARAAGIGAGMKEPPDAAALQSLPDGLRRTALIAMWKTAAGRQPDTALDRALAQKAGLPVLAAVFPAVADSVSGRSRELAAMLPRSQIDPLLADWLRCAPRDAEHWAAQPGNDPPSAPPRSYALAAAALTALRGAATRPSDEQSLAALDPLAAHALRGRQILLAAAENPGAGAELMQKYEVLSADPKTVLRNPQPDAAAEEQAKAGLAQQTRIQRQQYFHVLAATDPALAMRWLKQRLAENPSAADFSTVPPQYWKRPVVPGTGENTGDVLPEDGLVLARAWLRTDPESALREACDPRVPDGLRRMIAGAAVLPGEFSVPTAVLESWIAADASRQPLRDALVWLRENKVPVE